MATITMKELLEAGVHFGHLTRKWNPKMKEYIFSKRNGIHIIDLRHTLMSFKKASNFITEVVGEGGKVLFVGTKRQAQTYIKESAESVSMPYVTERWLGGTLTNYRTIKERIQYLKELQRMEADETGRTASLTKKERLILMKERQKLERLLSGILDMGRLPAALFVVDIRKEKNCIREARKKGIPIVALVDTNCDPDEVDYPIPGNDDAVRAIHLFAEKIAQSVQEGKDIYQSKEKAREEEEALAEKVRRDLEGEKKPAPAPRKATAKKVAARKVVPMKVEEKETGKTPVKTAAVEKQAVPVKADEPEKETKPVKAVKKVSAKTTVDKKVEPATEAEKKPASTKTVAKPSKTTADKKAKPTTEAEKKPAPTKAVAKPSASKEKTGTEQKAEKKAATAKKATVKKASEKKAATGKETKDSEKKPVAKTAAKKTPTKKAATKKEPAKKATVKKETTAKPAAKKAGKTAKKEIAGDKKE